MASSPKPPVADKIADDPSSAGGADLRAWMVQYGPALRRYFLRRAAAADVDDLVQEVFLRLQGRGAATEIENVEGYLFRTAANVLGQRRRRATWPWGAQEDPGDIDALTDAHSPERILIGKQALERLMQLVDELPPRTAQAFILYRFEHLTREAVGRRMGISAKAVEALLKRAFERLYDQSEWRA
ncbi:MAG TPA: sigma-70 family RNA polymerase sigma factor [Caulobacteraceae bacterium]